MHRTATPASITQLAFAALILGAASASAQNLLANSDFDHNLNYWTINAADGSAHWDALDAADDAASGSAQITNIAAGGNTFSGPLTQCMPVTPGASYDLSAKARIAPFQSRTGYALVQVMWRSNPDCSGYLDYQQGPSTTTVGIWAEIAGHFVAPAAAQRAMIQLALVKNEAGGTITGNFDDISFRITPGACGDPETTLCLEGGRFRVSMAWRISNGQTGAGRAVPLSDNSGYFWFFDASNAEVMVKLLDACAMPATPRFWFFAAGMTNVHVVTTVEDLEEHVTRTYTNPLNTPFKPLQDTNAFATCP